jgi:two-component system phosphate regulon sensor histidine kinase PhoR
MNFLRHKLLLPAAALVLSSVLAGGWLLEPWLGAAPIVVRGLLVTAAFALAVFITVYVARCTRNCDRMIQRCFELLCDVQGHQLAADSALPSVPAPPVDHPWHDVWNRVCERLAYFAAAAEQAEHARAAAEVRVQRITQRCDHLESILKGLPEPVLAVNQYDELLLANPAAEKLFEFDARTAQERVVSELVHCERLIELLVDGHRRKTRACRTSEVQIPDRDGQAHWYSIALATFPMEGAAGTGTLTATSLTGSGGGPGPRGAVAVLRDISGLKAVQKRNAEFVSSVSHEMKAPLAGIKAYSELLADDEAPDEHTREEFLEVINSQADRLQRLIDNLLNLARIEAGVVEVKKKPQSLNDVLTETLHVVQPAAQAKNIELVSDLSQLYLGVLVDRDMMMQAAINLMSNAVKYTPVGGKVTLRSRMDGGQVVFEVEDTGVGLSPEDSVKIFEKFYRVKKDRDMAPGTGLGLPLAKHIVEEVHGGTLNVESQLGVGSKFIVSLPAAGQME